MQLNYAADIPDYFLELTYPRILRGQRLVDVSLERESNCSIFNVLHQENGLKIWPGHRLSLVHIMRLYLRTKSGKLWQFFIIYQNIKICEINPMNKKTRKCGNEQIWTIGSTRTTQGSGFDKTSLLTQIFSSFLSNLLFERDEELRSKRPYSLCSITNLVIMGGCIKRWNIFGT